MPQPGGDGGDRYQSAAERLRALEMSGDPDVRDIARGYRSGPLDPTGPAMRQVVRSLTPMTGALAPTYARATDADADEAEAKAATLRAQREKNRMDREHKLYEFAEAAHGREKTMLKLTTISAVLALVSLIVAAVAIVVAA